jgi:undecaprenyl phosphate N,N'-diacetylbacillosamine 1-phosphate transferase
MRKLKNVDDSNIKFGFYAKYVKRPLDVLISLSALIGLSPLLLIICILVKINIGSPIFFKQIRGGRDEEPFEMIKFKTMRDVRDSNGNLLPDTERLSGFGNILRSTSLDELPELINVLKGDMSLIGPRPLFTFYVPYYTGEEAKRHAVRVGITGLAQVNGRALCRWDQRFAYDVEYVNNLTFINDMKIFVKTILKVFIRADVGEPGIDEEKPLHMVREVQRLQKMNDLNWRGMNSDGVNNIPAFDEKGDE